MDLVERLKSASNDVVLLSQIIENNDSVSVAVAFATLLAGGDSSERSGSKRRKKVSVSFVQCCTLRLLMRSLMRCSVDPSLYLSRR